MLRGGTEHAARITAHWQVKRRINGDQFSHFSHALSYQLDNIANYQYNRISILLPAMYQVFSYEEGDFYERVKLAGEVI